jgi:Fe-S cluster biogenesis protein NfuA
MAAADKIPVNAQINPANPRVCLFTVGKPLFPGGSFNCPDAERAKGSPLLIALFGLPGIVQVWVADDRLTVEKNSDEPWPILGRRVADTVRTLIRAGVQPLVAPPKQKPGASGLLRRVEEILEREINPRIAAHGGRVDVREVKDGIAYLTMSGGCQGCTAAAMTLRSGVESAILSRVPEIAEIVDVTNHGAGDHPYYKSGQDAKSPFQS